MTGGQGRVRAFDGIRGVAITLVLVDHVAAVPSAGLVGVLLFFVLSGYLITSVIGRDVASTGRLDYRRFYIRRALRLLPALLLMLALVVAVSFVPGSGIATESAVTGTWQGLLYVTDFTIGFGFDFSKELGHLWTLAVEEHFYLVWPIVAVLLLRRPQGSRLRPALWIIGAAVALRLATVLAGLSLDWFVYTLPTVWAECLLVGAALAAVNIPRHPLRVRPGVVSVVAIVVLLGMSLHPDTYQSWMTYVIGVPLLTAAAAWIVWQAMTPGWVQRGLEWAPVRWLGDRSYAIYLFNAPLIWIAASAGDYLWWRCLGAAVSILLAMASRRFVELPALRLKDRLGGAISRQAPSTRPGPTTAPNGPGRARVSPAAGES